MPNLKSLRTRIRSVRSTQKMTKAMKVVSASRLKRAKDLVEATRPYAEKIEKMVSEISSQAFDTENLSSHFPMLFGKSDNSANSYLLLIMSSDRGFCGGLNSSTVRFAKNRINSLLASGKTVKIFFVGKKAHDQMRTAYNKEIIGHSFGLFKNRIEYKMAETISEKLISLFDEGGFDVCEVIYSGFKSPIVQDQICKRLIPVGNSFYKGEAKFPCYSSFLYEPDKKKILSKLLEKNLAFQIYNELLETSASEQGARMSAMEAASNNAGEMIKKLALAYNRSRQSNITKELIDIVSGANVV